MKDDLLTDIEFPDVSVDLVGFALEILDQRSVMKSRKSWSKSRSVYGGIDGFELQEIAVRHGVLAEVRVTEPCCEHCFCQEFYDSDEFATGVTCYRAAKMLMDARRERGDQ